MKKGGQSLSGRKILLQFRRVKRDCPPFFNGPLGLHGAGPARLPHGTRRRGLHAIREDTGAPAPQTNTAPEPDNGLPEAGRRLDAAQRQIDAFRRPDGTMQTFGDGPCAFRDVPAVE